MGSIGGRGRTVGVATDMTATEDLQLQKRNKAVLSQPPALVTWTRRQSTRTRYVLANVTQSLDILPS